MFMTIEDDDQTTTDTTTPRTLWIGNDPNPDKRLQVDVSPADFARVKAHREDVVTITDLRTGRRLEVQAIDCGLDCRCALGLVGWLDPPPDQAIKRAPESAREAFDRGYLGGTLQGHADGYEQGVRDARQDYFDGEELKRELVTEGNSERQLKPQVADLPADKCWSDVRMSTLQSKGPESPLLPIHCLDCDGPAWESCVRWHRVKGTHRRTDKELSKKHSGDGNIASFHDNVVTLDGDFSSADLKAIIEDMEGRGR